MGVKGAGLICGDQIICVNRFRPTWVIWGFNRKERRTQSDHSDVKQRIATKSGILIRRNVTGHHGHVQ